MIGRIQSDAAAGERLGEAVAQALLADPEFASSLAQARREWIAPPAAAPPRAGR